MAIIITDQYKLRQRNYLDDRQGLASSISALKSWDFSNVPIPEGFEVCVSGIWYVYNSGNSSDATLGKFRRRKDTEGIENLEARMSAAETKEIQLDFDDKRDTVATFNTLLTESFWKDSTGENHVRAGRIVTVTGDTADKNGPWYLTNSNYSQAASWIKLISRGDLIKTTDTTTPSDINLYTAANVDKIFPKKADTETISGAWTFTNNAAFTKNISVTERTTTKNLDVSDTATIGTNLEVGSNLSVGGILDVSRDARFEEDIEVSGGATIDGDVGIKGDTVIDKTLTVKGNVSLEEEVDLAKGKGSIKEDSGGKLVITADKVVADIGDFGNLDAEITRRMGLIGVNNLLLNTSFRGQFDTIDVNEETNLYNSDDMFSSNRENWKVTTADWNVIEDSGSITGYSLMLETLTSSFSQLTDSALIKDETYVLSWKQKGTITVTLNEKEVNQIEISSDQTTGYHRYYAFFTPDSNGQVRFRATGGPGYICEIKLEEGIVPTTWFPNVNDTDPVASKFKYFEFLRTSFEEHEGDGLVSSVFLKTQLKIGEYLDGEVKEVYGGISGVTSDGRDAILWFGSTYEEAQNLIAHILSDPNYLDTLTLEQLRELSKIIITRNSRTILTDVYAAGKFRGIFEGEFIGIEKPRHGLTAKIPVRTNEDGILIFKNGILLDSNNEPETVTLVLENPDSGEQSTLTFVDGLETTAISQGSLLTTPVYNNLGGSIPSTFYLSFNEQGYLVMVTEEDNTENYYWY